MADFSQNFPRLGTFDPALVDQTMIDPTKTNRLGRVAPAPVAAAPFGGLQLTDLPPAVPMASRGGGASGDWENAAVPTVATSAVAARPAAPTVQPAAAVPRARPAGIAPQAEAPAPGSVYSADPVQVISGSRVSNVLPLYDENNNARPSGFAATAATRAGGGGFGLANPAGTIDSAFDRQMAMNREVLAQATDYVQGGGNVFEQATRTKLMAPLIASIINGNDLGRSQAGGVNTMNSAAAGIAGAGIGAGAQRYSADARLTGDMAQNNVHQYEVMTSSVPTGTTLVPDPVTGLGVPVTTYGQRPAAGGMPTPYQQAKPQGPAEGSTSTSKGKPIVYRNGQWVPQ